MILRRNLKYRLYPTTEQEHILRRWEGVLRFLWNICHEQRLLGMARPKDERIYPDYYGQKREMTQLLEEYPWISEVQCQARQEVLADLDKAWSRCFKKVGNARQPHWKRKTDSMRIFAPVATVGYLLSGGRTTGKLTFDGPRYKPLGTFKIVLDRPTQGTIKSWTIKRDLDEWYAIASCEIEVEDPKPVNDKVVGIDRGVAIFLADSEGHTFPNIRAREQLEHRIRRAQRQACRKRKGSKNQKKANLKVAKLLRRAARQREVLIGTASKYYADNYGTVIVEKLNIVGMTASAKGTVDAPGSNVAQKAGLNKAILDAGWGAFNAATAYKVAAKGGRLIEVNPAHTSQTCPSCGHVDPENRPSQAVFKCVKCGFEGNADIVAGVNIKARGLALLNPEQRKKVKTFQRGRKAKAKTENLETT